MMKENNKLLWRYATKIFDKNKKVSEKDFQYLLESVRLAPSSYGLQPFKLFVVSNSDVRKKLKTVSWDQPQITDASHLVVFTSLKDMSSDYISQYIKRISDTRNIPLKELDVLKTRIQDSVKGRTAEEVSIWTSKQAYIAMGFLLQTCAELEIDACPMEGIQKNEYDIILDLNKKGLKSDFVVAVGYRSQEDALQYAAKVRKKTDEMFEFLE